MKKKVSLLSVFVMLITSVIGCGNNVPQEEAVAYESESSNRVETENSIESSEVESTDEETIEVEPTYTEKQEVVLLDGVDHNLAKEEDRIDVESMPRIEGESSIVITKEVDIYSDDGLYAGYAKIGSRPRLDRTNDAWTSIVFEGGIVYCVKTDELPDAMMLASEYDKLVAENTESEEKESTEILPTYTVTDMSKTMYAKQSVNVRKGPNSDYEKLGGLSTNQEVTVTGQADTGWYRITFNGSEAFVSNSYLSDTMVQVAVQPETTIPDGGTNGESVPLVPEPETVPETPSTTYSEAEVISIVRSTLEGGGLQWYPDSDLYAQYPEFGLDGGMGWGISEVSMINPQTDANSLLEGAQWRGYHYFYIENLGSSNGIVTIKVYGGG